MWAVREEKQMRVNEIRDAKSGERQIRDVRIEKKKAELDNLAFALKLLSSRLLESRICSYL